MFEYNFPKTNFDFYEFFKKEDKKTFPLNKETAKRFFSPDPGLILPWTLSEGKAYTLMANEQTADQGNLKANPEQDKSLRQKGLALKKEIRKIFSQ